MKGIIRGENMRLSGDQSKLMSETGDVTPEARSKSPSPVPHLGNVQNQLSRPSEPSELNSALTNVEMSKLGPRTSEPFNAAGFSVRYVGQEASRRSPRDEVDVYTVGLAQ